LLPTIVRYVGQLIGNVFTKLGYVTLCISLCTVITATYFSNKFTLLLGNVILNRTE